MKGNPSYRNNTGSSRNARWPFRNLLNGFLPMTLTQNTSLPPPSSCAAFCLLVTLLQCWCDVEPFTFVFQFIHPPPLLTPLFLLSFPSYHFSPAQWNNRYVEKRSSIMYHCGICDIDYGHFMFTEFFFCTLHCLHIYPALTENLFCPLTLKNLGNYLKTVTFKKCCPVQHGSKICKIF